MKRAGIAPSDPANTHPDSDAVSSYFRSIINSLQEAIIVTDEHGLIQTLNESASRVFGYTQEELHFKNINILMPEPYASQHDNYIVSYIKGGSGKLINRSRQFPAIRKSGDIFQIELSLTETTFKKQRLFIGLIRDIKERIKSHDAIYRMAYTDPMTGLKNRAWFERESRDHLYRASLRQHYIACSIIDIDNLGKINQQYGIETGNKVLTQLSNSLKQLSQDVFASYKVGHDEFIVMSVRSSEDRNTLEEQQQALANVFSTMRIPLGDGKDSLEVTSSLAEVIYPVVTPSVENLIAYLEYARVQSKSNAPAGRFTLSGKQLDTYERLENMTNAISTVATSQELRLVLQPQYESRGQFLSSEALVRWRSPIFGDVSPAEFIPIAEQSSAIVEIGEWVLNEVCRILAKALKIDPAVRISANISAQQLLSNTFEPTLEKLIEKWNIPTHAIMLELTESTLISDINNVKRVMKRLRNNGFHFSVDDFGTGYSSLAYLQKLPISELKIDKSFVDDLDHPEKVSSKGIVNLIIEMAEVLNVKTVAEGVEKDSQFDYLKQKGCDMIQGFLMSKPLEVDEWLAKFEKQFSNVEKAK